MKFSTNTSVVSPNTINARYTAVTEPMAYGANGKEWDALTAAVGQGVKAAQKEQDDRDAADVMEARNKIMGDLTETMYGENGMFTTRIGEKAKNLERDVTDVTRHTFDYYARQYNPRVQEALRRNLSENMGNFQRLAGEQEGREFEKQKLATYGGSLANNQENAVKNFANAGIVDSIFRDTMNLVRYRAADQGYNGVQLQAETRNQVSALMSKVFDSTLAATEGNPEMFMTADAYLRKYRPYMDQATVVKYEQAINKNKDVHMAKNDVDWWLKQPGNINPDGTPNMAKWNQYKESLQSAKEFIPTGPATGASRTNKRLGDIANETASILKKQYGINANPDFLYGQMMFESTLGEDPAALKNNNFAGLHGGAEGKSYKDDHEFAEDYAAIYAGNPNYVKAVQAPTATEFVDDIMAGGYFTATERRDSYIQAVDQYGNEGKGWDVDKAGRAFDGKRMNNGVAGCVEAVTKIGAEGGNSFLKKELDSGVASVPQLIRDAGGNYTDGFDASTLQKGDVIVYGGDDHVVIYDGNGGYWGNSSDSANGGKNPHVVHGSDYTQMDGLQPTGIIHTGGGAAGSQPGYYRRKYSDTMLDMADKYLRGRAQDMQAQANQQNLQIYYAETEKLKNMSAADAAAYLSANKDTWKPWQRVGGVSLYGKLVSDNRVYHPAPKVTVSGGSRSGGGSRGSSGGYTQKQIENAKDDIDEYNARVADPNDHISAKDQTRYNRAARLLNRVTGATGDNLDAGGDAVNIASHALEVTDSDEEAEWYLQQPENGGFSESEAHYYVGLAKG